MYIARILYPVKVLGPGNRVGIWFSGCEHGCPGCSNPELWEQHSRYKTGIATVAQLLERIRQMGEVDGYTLTGGDPFYQPEGLDAVLNLIRPECEDILVYTGYTYDYLRERYPGILDKIGVLIDGPYLRERNHGCFLRGSDNQKILVLNAGLEEKYRAYLDGGENQIQNFTTRDGVISVGIHRPEYSAQVDQILRKKGLERV